MYRTHRAVVLPDYQGLGIMTTMHNYIGELYKSEGKRFTITTSNPAMIFGLAKSEKWRVGRVGRVGRRYFWANNKKVESPTSSARITASLEYKGIWKN